MIYYKDDKFEFFPVVCNFYDNGEPVEIHTTNPSQLENMCKKNTTRFSEFKISKVEPTDEQISRLETVNSLKLVDPESWTQQLSYFVESGYVVSNCPSFMSKLKALNTQSSKEYLISNIKTKLSSAKSEMETAGCDFFGLTVKTDSEAQSKITSTLVSMQAGIISSVNFKFGSTWVELTKDQFSVLVSIVTTHIQSCFNAEKQVVASLQSMTYNDLEKLGNPDVIDTGVVENLFNTTYKSIYTSAISDLGNSLDASVLESIRNIIPEATNILSDVTVPEFNTQDISLTEISAEAFEAIDDDGDPSDTSVVDSEIQENKTK